MKAKHLGWGIAILLLIVVGSQWLFHLDAPITTKQPSSHTLLSAMQQVKQTQFNAQGKKQTQLISKKTERFANYTRFIAPKFTLFEDNKVNWILTAKYARKQHHQAKIILTDHITLTKIDPTHPVVLHTNRLTLDLKQHSASTTAPVTLREANQTLTSQGITIDLKKKKIILNKVKSHFN